MMAVSSPWGILPPKNPVPAKLVPFPEISRAFFANVRGPIRGTVCLAEELLRHGENIVGRDPALAMPKAQRLRPPGGDHPAGEWNVIEKEFRPDFLAQFETVVALVLAGRDLFTHAYYPKQLRNGRNLLRAKHLV